MTGTPQGGSGSAQEGPFSRTERASAETVSAPAPSSAGRPRELPVISVDLRGVSAGRRSAVNVEPTERDLEIVSVLGEGGMARVYLARQRSLCRDVAIKTLQENAAPAHRDALLEEGVVTGFLEHPGIVPVHALGLDVEGRPVLVMKRVEGVAWSELLRDPEHPAWEGPGADPGARLDEHLEILRQVCNAAHFAHSRGVIHRDIKPQNVLIGRFGDVYLADWGIAHRVGSGDAAALCGTPGYMAPEMMKGLAVDARTDVYLLGATLHEILTGELRHPGATLPEILRSVQLDAPYAYGPRVPSALAEIARRATAREPEDRHESAAELRAALSDYARHASSIALATSALERLPRLRELASADREDEATLRELDQRIAEVRFGLTQATAQWSANAAAAQGLAELDALLAARRARTAELERIARDLDPSVGARQRGLAHVALAVMGGLISVVALARGFRHQPTADDLIKEGIGPAVVVGGVIAALWRHIWRTAVNRRIALVGAVVVTAILLDRVLDARASVVPAQILGHDAMLVAAVCLASVGRGLRWLGAVAAIMLATAAACSLFPARAMLAFAVGSAASLLCSLSLGARAESGSAR